eukprot:symbB.v1.2.017468.t1/scaffold1361.1/size175804/8
MSETASWALRNDKELVLEAVRRNGLSLRHAASAVRCDREVVLAAIRDCPMALEHASDSIRRDREFIVTAMRISVRAAGGLSKELCSDAAFAQSLLEQFPSALAYFSKDLRHSRDFILTAVRANGDVLRYASGWHCDPEVVLTAIEKASHAVHYVDTRLRQRVEFGHAAVMVNCWAFEQLSSYHRGSLKLALEAARAQPALAHFASEAIRNEVVYTIKKEQSESVGVAPGYVEGPVCTAFFGATPCGMGKAGSAKAEPKKEPEKAKAQAEKSKDAKGKTEAKEPAAAKAEDPKAKLLEEAKQKYADDERDELARVQLRNQNREAKAKGAQLSGNRDKSIARVTRFQNRLKLFKGEIEIDAVMKDIDGVDASKYVSELSDCILEGAGNTLKLKELSAVSKVCSKLNATYEEYRAKRKDQITSTSAACNFQGSRHRWPKPS